MCFEQIWWLRNHIMCKWLCMNSISYCYKTAKFHKLHPSITIAFSTQYDFGSNRLRHSRCCLNFFVKWLNICPCRGWPFSVGYHSLQRSEFCPLSEVIGLRFGTGSVHFRAVASEISSMRDTLCSLGSHKMKGSAHTTYAVPATALQILLMLARYIPCTPSALDNVV